MTKILYHQFHCPRMSFLPLLLRSFPHYILMQYFILTQGLKMLFKKTRNNIQIITGRETFPRSVSEGTNDTAYDNQHHTREYNFLFPMANVYPPGDALFASLP